MQDIWAVKQEKDFMIIQFRERMRVVLMGVILLWAGCSPDLSDESIAPVTFPDKILNLSLPEYSDLNSKKYKYIGGGVRGIIIVKINEQQYRAYERNCPFRPQEPSATVEVHSSLLYIEDPVCGSQFKLSDGEPTQAPADRPLRRYHTSLNGTELTITDDVENQ
jgi:nitrite reductase/ring-hydroxylating ferredoxin subunit